MTRTRYARVGTGDPGLELFARAILTMHADVAELVGPHDVVPLRVQAARDLMGRPVASGGWVRIADLLERPA